MFSFRIIKRLHKARLTALHTPHGVIEGPFFQFVATQAAIRGQVFSEDLAKMEVQIVLANTFHLHLRPGEDVVSEAGGLHGFMQWDQPITTDSGGYQVFSLAQGRKLDADGVTFRSPLDGSPRRLTPESAITIQQKLGADLIMPLDVCTPYGASKEEIEAAVDQTIVWAKRCKNYVEDIGMGPVSPGPSRPSLSSASPTSSGAPRNSVRSELSQRATHTPPRQVLYGIVQGGLYPDLRERCALALREVGFFGYAIGGELREGEESSMEEGLRVTLPHLPADAPRYHMGAGTPEDIVRAVRLGVDHFDCVLPVRNARHGKIYRNLNREELQRCLEDPERPVAADELYETMDIRKAAYASEAAAFSPGHPVIERPYSIGYVHHLLRAEPPSGYRLAVLHNIYFYEQLMRAIREILARS